MDAVQEELTLPKPYAETAMARRAAAAARRLSILGWVASAAFLGYGLALAPTAGPWALLALAQAGIAWKLPERGLTAVALAAVEVLLGVLLPVVAAALALLGKPGFPLLPTLAVGGVTLALALYGAPAAVTLLKDQDLQEAYPRTP